jgi:hypothetical protein
MKIANNYFQTLKTIKEESKISEKLPDTIAQAPESKTESNGQTQAQTTVNSDAAKLKSKAQETISRIRVESQIGKNLDLNRLNNMTKAVKEIAPEIKEGQLERLIGSHVNTGSAKGVIDGIRGLGGSRDHLSELTGSKIDDLRMVGGSLVSADPPPADSTQNDGYKVAPPSLKDIVINFFMGQASSRTVPIPTLPVPPDPQTGKDMWSGVTFFQDVLGIGNYENRINERGGIDTNGTPNPDAEDTGGPHIITRDMLNGIAAKRGSKGEPNPEGENSSGGPINETKASGGATGPAGEPVMDADVTSAVVTSRDVDALRIKLESKFIKP